MDWKDVGDWLKKNGGTGAALVGSLLTGNVPAAVAAGVALVGSATGEATPDKAMQALQSDPATMLRLRELAVQEDASIREHVRGTMEMQLRDQQAEHEATQATIRSGDNSEDPWVRRTRPAHATASLLAAIVYVFSRDEPSVEIALLLFTLPWAYAGLRQIGKGVDMVAAAVAARRGAGKG